MLLLLTVSVCSHLLGAEIHMLVEMAFKSNLSCLCHQWECSTYKVGTFFFFFATFEVLQPQRTQWETAWRSDSHQETGSQTSSLASSGPHFGQLISLL